MERSWIGGSWIALAASLAGCTPDLVPPTPPQLVASSVDASPDGVPPTATLALRFSLPLDADSVDETSVLLLRGAPDDPLLKALDGGPPTDAVRDELAPIRLAVDGAAIAVRPARPLVPNALHTIIVTTRVTAGGTALAAPALRPFTTGGSSTGAPWVTLVAPPPGSIDVVRNLRAVEVRFSRPVSGVDATTLRLVDDAGAPVAARVTGSMEPGGYLLHPETLAPLRRFVVAAADSIRDDDGDPPFAFDPPPGFTTGATVRTRAPAIADAALDAASGCLVARWTTDRAASSSLCLGGDCTVDGALVARHALGHPLAAGARAEVTLSSRDESTAPAAVVGPLPSPDSSPRPLSITEVLTHPRGARLAQQFVEVHNRGPDPVALDGLVLSNATGSNALPSLVLPPAGYALIVPADFVPDDGLDVPPAPGTPLAFVAESHLGARGLRETGDTLLLAEPDGRPVSRFSTVGLRLAPGQSARRVAPCDLDGAYAPTPGQGATPGWE